MTDDEIRIHLQTDVRLKQLVVDAGLSTDAMPPVGQVLAALRAHAPAVVDLLLWRLAQTDALAAVGRIGPVELRGAIDVLEALANAVQTRLSRFHAIIEVFRLDAAAPVARPDWLAEWRAANPGRDDRADTALQPGDVCQWPAAWDDPNAAGPWWNRRPPTARSTERFLREDHVKVEAGQ